MKTKQIVIIINHNITVSLRDVCRVQYPEQSRCQVIILNSVCKSKTDKCEIKKAEKGAVWGSAEAQPAYGKRKLASALTTGQARPQDLPHVSKGSLFRSLRTGDFSSCQVYRGLTSQFKIYVEFIDMDIRINYFSTLLTSYQ